jgi:hypothetical protein
MGEVPTTGSGESRIVSVRSGATGVTVGEGVLVAVGGVPLTEGVTVSEGVTVGVRVAVGVGVGAVGVGGAST